MKKRLVAYLMVSALAVAVFAGCSKKDGGDAADAAATAVEEAVEEAVDEAVEEAGDEIEAESADNADEGTTIETVAVAGTSAAADEIAAEDEEDVAEFVDDEEKVEGENQEETPAEGEYYIANVGDVYTIRFGGNIYSTPEENPANIMYEAKAGDYVNILERLDNFWYKVSYYLAYDPTEYVGYIQIQ